MTPPPVLRLGQESSTPVAFAAVGDVHAHHVLMVDLVQKCERESTRSVAFILQVGDFEPTRNDDDLQTMPVPRKYRVLGDFHLFAAGENLFPWPIIFVGGNHEPYGFLDHYIEGGVIHALNGAPILNCYYMGLVGWADLWGMRVIGVSGIFANEDVYNSERPASTMIGTAKLKRFAYMRHRDVERAYEIASAVQGDVWLLHDWPESDLGARLGRGTKFDGKQGNPHTLSLVGEFIPQRVLCGHMHIPMDWEIPQGNGSSTLVHALGYLPLAGEGCVQILEWDASARSIRRVARWNGGDFRSWNQ